MARYQILICEHDGCGESVSVRVGSLPHCPHCDQAKKKRPKWREALTGEITKNDRRMLAALRIAAT